MFTRAGGLFPRLSHGDIEVLRDGAEPEPNTSTYHDDRCEELIRRLAEPLGKALADDGQNVIQRVPPVGIELSITRNLSREVDP